MITANVIFEHLSRLCPLAFQHLAVVPGPSEPTEIVTVETSDTAGEETVIGETLV